MFFSDSVRPMPMYDEAIGFLRAAVAARPDAALGWLGLGSKLRLRGSLDEAIASFREIIRLKPDLAFAHMNLGSALSQHGDLEDAIVSCKEAIRLDSDLAMAYSNRGLSLLLSGRFADAETALAAAPPSVMEGAQIQQLASFIQSILNEETKLVGILKKNGAADPSVPERIRKVSINPPFSPATSDSVKAFWQENPQEVAAALGTVAIQRLNILRIPENQLWTAKDQENLANKLPKQALTGTKFDELAEAHAENNVSLFSGNYAKGDLSPKLSTAAFSLKPGEISKLIELSSVFIILKLDQRTPERRITLKTKAWKRRRRNVSPNSAATIGKRIT